MVQNRQAVVPAGYASVSEYGVTHMISVSLLSLVKRILNTLYACWALFSRLRCLPYLEKSSSLGTNVI